jgi:uncharacterized protein YjeT (DUF2065 family)
MTHSQHKTFAWLLMLVFGGIVVVAACTPGADKKIATALRSPPGQLFCSVQMAGGGTMIAGVIDAEASALAPAAAQVAVLATGLGKARVDDLCNEAAVRNGGLGAKAVPPPPDPAMAALLPVVLSQLAPPR